MFSQSQGRTGGHQQSGGSADQLYNHNVVPQHLAFGTPGQSRAPAYAMQQQMQRQQEPFFQHGSAVQNRQQYQPSSLQPEQYEPTQFLPRAPVSQRSAPQTQQVDPGFLAVQEQLSSTALFLDPVQMRAAEEIAETMTKGDFAKVLVGLAIQGSKAAMQINQLEIAVRNQAGQLSTIQQDVSTIQQDVSELGKKADSIDTNIDELKKLIVSQHQAPRQDAQPAPAWSRQPTPPPPPQQNQQRHHETACNNYRPDDGDWPIDDRERASEVVERRHAARKMKIGNLSVAPGETESTLIDVVAQLVANKTVPEQMRHMEGAAIVYWVKDSIISAKRMRPSARHMHAPGEVVVEFSRPDYRAEIMAVSKGLSGTTISYKNYLTAWEVKQRQLPQHVWDSIKARKLRVIWDPNFPTRYKTEPDNRVQQQAGQPAQAKGPSAPQHPEHPQEGARDMGASSSSNGGNATAAQAVENSASHTGPKPEVASQAKEAASREAAKRAATASASPMGGQDSRKKGNMAGSQSNQFKPLADVSEIEEAEDGGMTEAAEEDGVMPDAAGDAREVQVVGGRAERMEVVAVVPT